MTKKRVRSVPIYVWVRPDELEVIRERMAEAGIRNMSAYIRKMALGGYVLHVDLEPVKELVSLQRRCANNLNQAAIGCKRTMPTCGGRCLICWPSSPPL